MNEKSKLWYLENFNMFKELPIDDLMIIEKMTTMQEIAKTNPIYFASEPSNSIFFVKKGRVKLSKMSSDGREIIMGIMHPGDVFGEMALVDEIERTDFAYAMESALICAISKDEFKKYLENNPKLNIEITKLIGFRLKKFSERIEQLVFKDAPQRIISLIISFAVDYGKKFENEFIIRPFLTHQDIAKLTACSRQTVNSVLTELREEDLIKFDRKKFIVKDLEKLKNYCYQKL